MAGKPRNVELPAVGIGAYEPIVRALDANQLASQYLASSETIEVLRRELAAAYDRSEIQWAEIRRRGGDVVGAPNPAEETAMEGMGELDRQNRRQAQLDALQDNRDERLVALGRALVEWAGIDPTDPEALEAFHDAVGGSSIPEAAATVGASLTNQEGQQ